MEKILRRQWYTIVHDADRELSPKRRYSGEARLKMATARMDAKCVVTSAYLGQQLSRQCEGRE